jgi:hypothetical protein
MILTGSTVTQNLSVFHSLHSLSFFFCFILFFPAPLNLNGVGAKAVLLAEMAAAGALGAGRVNAHAQPALACRAHHLDTAHSVAVSSRAPVQRENRQWGGKKEKE